MKYRRLGGTKLNVSALGLGCGRLGSVTQADGDQAALRLIGAALDAGINLFDTADIYGQGKSERLLAQALRGKRDKVVIATKAGFCLSSMGLLARYVKPLLRRVIRSRPGFAASVRKVRAAQQKQDFSSAYLAGCLEQSLKRLETEAVDVFLLHSPPTEVLERGEIFEALDGLKQQGKLRHYGVSCRKMSDIEICLKYPGVEVLQVEMNLLTEMGPLVSTSTDAGDSSSQPSVSGLLPRILSRDLGVMIRQALAGGLLMREAPDLRPEDLLGRDWDFETVNARLEKMSALAAQTHRSVPQLALQFLLENDAISTVLIGTTRVEHLQKHLPAVDLPPLSPEHWMRLGLRVSV